MIRVPCIALAFLLAVGCLSPPSPNVLHVASSGEITLNGTAIDRDELPAKLDKETPVVIRTSPQTPHTVIVGVLDVVRQAEVHNVSLAAEAVR